MARSGSVDFTLTRNQIIQLAMSYIGKTSLGETPTAGEVQEASLILNAMVKAWHSDGMHLWKRSDATLFLEKGKQSYTLSSSGDHCTLSYNESTLTNSEAASATVIEVASSTDMAASNNVGIVLDSGIFHWTTISTVDSSTQITIASGLDTVAASGNVIYAYTTKINRPLRILDAYRKDSSGSDIPVEVISKADYNELTPKTNQGTINQIQYNPELDSGKLYVWQTTDTIGDKLVMTISLPFEDFDASGNNPDFPVEWFDALYINLAYRLAPHFSIPLDERVTIGQEAAIAKEAALNFDNDNVSIFIQPRQEW